MKRLLLGLWLCLCVSGGLLRAVAEEDRVADVDVVGNVSVSSEVVLSQLQSKVGEAFLKETVNDDLRRIYSLGYFSDVTAEVDDIAGGVALTFVVEEKFSIGSVDVMGNRIFGKAILLKELGLSEGQIFNKKVLHEAVKKVRDMYQQKGFYKVEIDPQVTVDNFTRQVNVLLMVHEAKRVFVCDIEFIGNDSIPSTKLKKLMQTKQKWIFGGGIFKEETLEEDIQRLDAFYKFKGFMNAVVGQPQLTYSEDGRGLTLSIEVNEGPLYRVGILEVKGAELFPVEEVEDSLKMVEGEVFSQIGLLQDQRAIQEYYSDRGYVYARIRPSTYINDEVGLVDVTYTIQENDLVYVERIVIQGNVRTRDKVIRRELKIHPLEPFNGQKIKRSRQKLFNLNYFEDVSFETAPGSEPSMRDLIINVKEKKTGEFSLGGGYSSIDKFVGFLEVAQNNFDLFGFPSFVGAGQRMHVRVEFGGIRKTYSLGFTEPWLFDKPLLFGFDSYNREWDRTDYKEGRKGASVRLGHPIGEHNYILGHFKHEKVDINIKNAAELPGTIISEAGEKTINTLGIKFSRDTRDNAQFAREGALHSFSLESSGGILGGNIDIVRYLHSSNWFFETWDKWILDMRFRIGAIDSYSETKTVPFYERFYAGGASSVRGYEDRSVGPQERSEAVGGSAMLILNAEYSFPLFEMVRGAIFADAGNVWEGGDDWDLGDLKKGLGFGVRVKTPLGPIKLDYGFALDAADHEDDSRLHFSMGGFF